MKKLILAALVVSAGAWQDTVDAQFFVIKDGEVKVVLDYTPDYVTFEAPMLCGGVVGEAVDMGLSVKWSSVNVGASAPEDYGNYYAWGETKTKNEYTWATYKHMQSGKSSWEYINKYQAQDGQYRPAWYNSDKEFIGDGKTTLDKEDDAAAVNWGGDWAIPTQTDFEELCNNCYCVWTVDYNNTNTAGFIVYKAKVDADKGQCVFSDDTPSASYSLVDAHIFLPAAGYRDGSDLRYEGLLSYYWSASLFDSDAVCVLGFSSSYFNEGNSYGRCSGLSVRPVCPSSGEVNGHAIVDLDLPNGKLWATCNVGASAPQSAGDYFAWGETAAKTDYTWATYAHMRAGGSQWQDVNKYTMYDWQNKWGRWYNDALQFVGDNKATLEAEDDAATANWGGKWRTPTQAEWEELYNNTNRQWTNDYNGKGVAGYILTSTVAGHTDASIFLPAAGFRYYSYLEEEGTNGCYWSASLLENYSESGRFLDFNSDSFGPWYGSPRYNGYTVRPVCPAEE